MARIEDLIKNIPDIQLQNEIASEVSKLKANIQFGIVFEEHIPELVQLPNIPVKIGARVSKKKGTSYEVFKVIKSLQDGTYKLLNETTRVEISAKSDQLVVVKEFGDPIYPSLTMIDQVTRNPSKSYHSIIRNVSMI